MALASHPLEGTARGLVQCDRTMSAGIVITFLGTGSGIPTLQRNLACVALQREGELFLLDCGEAAQIGMRRAGLGWGRLEAILISHMHGDHVTGLPGIMMSLQMAENPPEGVHVSWEHEVDPTIQRRIKQLMHAEVVSPALNRLVRSHEVPDVPLWSAWSLLPLSSLSRAETSGGVSGPPRPGLAADASGGACRVRRARRGPGPPPAR